MQDVQQENVKLNDQQEGGNLFNEEKKDLL